MKSGESENVRPDSDRAWVANNQRTQYIIVKLTENPTIDESIYLQSIKFPELENVNYIDVKIKTKNSPFKSVREYEVIDRYFFSIYNGLWATSTFFIQCSIINLFSPL